MDPTDLLSEYVKPLQKALDIFLSKIDVPKYTKDKEGHIYKYTSSSPRIFQVLKCVRIVSGFNAGNCLLKKGFVQEVGVIIRILYEFLNDIEFIQAGIDAGNFTDKQKEMLNTFFAREIRSAKDLTELHKKQPTILRKKVYAALGRYLKPGNPDRTQRVVKAIEEAYSGYVHGEYPHIMELFNRYTETFHTNGMLGTPRIPTFTTVLALTLHQALNVFAGIALSWKLQDLADELIAARKSLEASNLYKPT